MDEDRETNSANDPSSEEKHESSKSGTPTKPAYSGHHDIYPDNPNQRSTQTDRSKQPLELIEKSWNFITEPKHSNAVVAIFTLLLFFVTLAYTFFAGLQWWTMKETLKEMKTSGDSATQQMWAAIGNLNWIAQNADSSLRKLSEQVTKTADLANAARDQAELTRQELVGTLAPKIKFTPYGGGENGFFNFQVINYAPNSVTAKNVRVEVSVVIRSWPDKRAFFHQPPKRLEAKDIPSEGTSQVTYMDERYFIAPSDVWEQVMSGGAFVEVDWNGSYNNGFGQIVRTGNKHECSVHLPQLKCSGYDGGFGNSGPCSDVDSMVKRLADDRRAMQQQYCKGK